METLILFIALVAFAVISEYLIEKAIKPKSKPEKSELHASDRYEVGEQLRKPVPNSEPKDEEVIFSEH